MLDPSVRRREASLETASAVLEQWLDRLIEIPELDSEEVLRELERRVRSRGYNPEEVERIKKLNFAPTPSTMRGFDPGFTAELFENAVSPPNFSNPKYRFLRGPLRILARLIFPFLSQLFDKLSENKIQAFYNVVHELIALQYRNDLMAARLQEIHEEFLEFKIGHVAGQDQSEKGNGIESVAAESTREYLKHLPLSGNSNLLVLNDSGVLRDQLKESGVVSARFGPAGIDPDIALHSEKKDSLDFILFVNVSRSPCNPSGVLSLASSRLRVGGCILLEFSRIQKKAFRRIDRFEIDPELLVRECEEYSLKRKGDFSDEAYHRILFTRVP